VQADQLLDLAVLAFEAGEVGLPEAGRVARAPEVVRHVLEAAVEAVRVDADHADALGREPERRLARHPGLLEVLAAAEEAVAAGHQHHDVERLEPVVDRGERPLEVGDEDVLARLLSRKSSTTPSEKNHSSGHSSIVLAGRPSETGP
jgi:hypothetical protein